MNRFLDISGKKFGKLLAVKRVGSDKQGRSLWLCKCDCGKEHITRLSSLLNGHTKSCGCSLLERNTKHGLYYTRLYEIWRAIKKRCYLKTHPHYKNYGGRGISMCSEWRDDVKAFVSWALSNGYDDSLSIDRIDNDGNYEPANCRWATVKEQATNRSTNHFLTYKNETKTITEWAKIIGINAQTISERVKRGWSDAQIIETPKRRHVA